LAVGGTNGFFPDEAVNEGSPKPWKNDAANVKKQKPKKLQAEILDIISNFIIYRPLVTSGTVELVGITLGKQPKKVPPCRSTTSASGLFKISTFDTYYNSHFQ